MATTRLAPSPTGALHLGNARTFLVNWLLARQERWKVVLRIEDLDGPRVRRGADRVAIEDLRWLGIDWDEGPVHQSAHVAWHREAARRLVEGGQAYACVCSRSEVERSASAPHAEDGAVVYPGTCRGRFTDPADAQAAVGRAPALRFRASDGEAGIVAWTDRFRGAERFDVARQLGDFIIAKADGTPAYQLAVVVDDADAGVTEVVRGDDLVDSTPRQALLYRALGWSDRQPRYTHLPLVVGPDGRRLAKRHGDTRLASYRERGVPPGRVLALLARWSGIPLDPSADARAIRSASDLVGALRLENLPRTPILFTGGDDAWLIQGGSAGVPSTAPARRPPPATR